LNRPPDAPAGVGRPRRILMIAPTSFFADYGCHVRILEQARGLAGRGHDITLCTYHSGRDIAGLRILRTPAVPGWRRAEVGSSWHKIALDALLFFLTLQTARRLRPDLLHAYLHEGALIGAIVGQLLSIPLVFDFQGSLTGEMIDHRFLRAGSLAHAPLRRLERWIDHRPALILANSEHSARLLTQQFGVPERRIRLVPDCIEPQRFCRREDAAAQEERRRLRAGLGLAADAPLIVYLGLLAPYQGIDLLLQALAQPALRPDAHLLVMGFPHVEHYRQMAAALGLAGRVAFTGAIAYEDAPHMLALGDVAVAPKISATEGSGKLLSYMAMGLPTVAFDTEVSREYLGDAGRLAPAGDAAALAQALRELLDDPAERAAMGRRLRQRAVERFDCRLVLDAIEAAHTAACGDADGVL
jgi:glycosyltransferase involved in cell wall biosynthesis